MQSDAILQLKSAAEAAWNARWRMQWDMNSDGVVGFADVWPIALWFFFAPGDAILLAIMIYATPVALFAGLDSSSISGVTSGIISAVIWLIGLGSIARRA